MSTVFEALSLLTPFDIDKPKVRLGPKADGGYVFVDDISPNQSVVSYGIADEYSLDFVFASSGHSVYMFDHTIEGLKTTHPNMHFFREGISGVTDDANKLYTLADHVERHAIPCERMILKIDVEGAEYDALLAIPDALLSQVEQIVIEIHSLDYLSDATFRDRFCAVFRKLNRHFTLAHVHANNFDGPDGFVVVEGFVVSKLLELSYIRTGSVQRRPSTTLYPTSLDFPNNSSRDKLLWIYPFVPSRCEASQYELSWSRNDMLASLRSRNLI